ncbi:MAG: putative toxin-antitoxin system toxin component, PIN family [Candidatus Aminicenantales bacterium]
MSSPFAEIDAVFELCLEKHTIIISERILSELSFHLQRKLKLPVKRVEMIIDYLKASCFLGQETPVKKSACRDEEDLHILGLAEKMRPDFIVTDDSDLLVLKRCRQTSIVTPREFWEKEKKRRSRR